jgi:hypothetical protein
VNIPRVLEFFNIHDQSLFLILGKLEDANSIACLFLHPICVPKKMIFKRKKKRSQPKLDSTSMSALGLVQGLGATELVCPA